jgi:hypothetical protein
LPDATTKADAAATHDAGSPGAMQPPAASEQCDNGKDDDGDGKVDCADSDCSRMTCVAEAPPGWQGPVALQLGSSAKLDCDSVFSRTMFAGGAEPKGAAASCSTCSCSASNGGCAAFLDFKTGSAAGCTEMATCTTSVNQSCTEIAPPCLAGLGTAYLRTKLPDPANSCTASPQTVSTEPAAWRVHALACGKTDTQRAGCKSAYVCLPASPGAGFEPAYCVWQDGETECPSTTFKHKQTYYRDLSDTRGCSACSCSGPDCSYSWQVFNSADTNCATPVLKLTSPEQCAQVNPSADKLRVGTTLSGDGKCTASGGATQGSVAGTKPITVCCAE